MEEEKNLILRGGKLHWGNINFDCSWGENGTISAKEKREGDKKTPEGSFLFRCIFYRADRIGKLETKLPVKAITPQDGWCDDPNDFFYNQHVILPYKGRHEELNRADDLYNIILTVGHNDDPVVSNPPMGSAIFVHIRRKDGGSTAGCVSIEYDALLQVIKEATAKSKLVVEPQQK